MRGLCKHRIPLTLNVRIVLLVLFSETYVFLAHVKKTKEKEKGIHVATTSEEREGEPIGLSGPHYAFFLTSIIPTAASPNCSEIAFVGKKKSSR
jgi:hypothetical protein